MSLACRSCAHVNSDVRTHACTWDLLHNSRPSSRVYIRNVRTHDHVHMQVHGLGRPRASLHMHGLGRQPEVDLIRTWDLAIGLPYVHVYGMCNIAQVNGLGLYM